ncbi:MAG: acireductone synthase [Synechococcaceae cyanobacterium]
MEISTVQNPISSKPHKPERPPMHNSEPLPFSSPENPQTSRPWQPRVGISHVLLDIEGTTCPVSFVAGSLFPYASDQLPTYLKEHGQESKVLKLLEAVRQSWREDPSESARSLLNAYGGPDAVGVEHVLALEAYLQLLIRCDRKLTALKELQGMIWRQGYAEGHLRAPLFEDVPEALRRWTDQGLVLAVYSSGSVEAQKLLYQYSSAGDLASLFNHWFDTRIGSKKDPESYGLIAAAMGCKSDAVLFVSDSRAELEAAADAGMDVLFSDRPGNPEHDPGPYPATRDYAELCIP